MRKGSFYLNEAGVPQWTQLSNTDAVTIDGKIYYLSKQFKARDDSIQYTISGKPNLLLVISKNGSWTLYDRPPIGNFRLQSPQELAKFKKISSGSKIQGRIFR